MKFWHENASGHYHLFAKGETPWKWIILGRSENGHRGHKIGICATWATHERSVTVTTKRFRYNFNVRWYPGRQASYSSPLKGQYWALPPQQR